MPTKSVSPARGLNRRLRRQLGRSMTPAEQRQWWSSEEVEAAMGAETCRQRLIELEHHAAIAARITCSAAWADAWWEKSPTPWPQDDRPARWRGRWRIGAVYGAGDGVMFQNRRWEAATLNRASAPTPANPDWRQVRREEGWERGRRGDKTPAPLSQPPALPASRPHAVVMALSLAETRNGLGPGHRRWTPPQCVESEDALDLMSWIEAAIYSHPPSPSAMAIWQIVTQGRTEQK